MRYYFAAAYQRHAEMQHYADVLTMATGAEVVSSWHRKVTPGLDNSFTSEYIAKHPAEVWKHGERDIEDLLNAEAIVSFTGQGGRGGRQIEHGIAIITHDQRQYFKEPVTMRLVVIGPREHVFHCHPATEVYRDFGAFLQYEIAGTSRPANAEH
jgi:hypothetical protein